MQAFIYQQYLRLFVVNISMIIVEGSVLILQLNFYTSKPCKEHELRHVIPDSDLVLAASAKHPQITAATRQQSILGVILRVIYGYTMDTEKSKNTP